MVNRHGTSLKTRPLLCQIDGQFVWADQVEMPFGDAQFASVTCLDLLAYVHDDQATIVELARVLKPGGRLIVRLPNEGPTAGLDSYNLLRYIADSTHVGKRPPETDELGWRRHFRERELSELLSESGFQVISSRTSGTGLPELAQLSAMIGFRWVRQSEEQYQRVLSWIDRFRDIDNRIPAGGFGYTRTVVAKRIV
jgi:SAM-dependent methyltransferase